MLSHPAFSSRRCYSSSCIHRALQLVDAARPYGSTGRSPSSLSSSSSGSYGTPNASGQVPSRFTLTGTSFSAANFSMHKARAGRQDAHVAQSRRSSPLDAVADDLASFDADDNSGPPETRNNSIRAPRLSFPGFSPEAFYFKQTLESDADGESGYDTTHPEMGGERRDADHASSLFSSGMESPTPPAAAAAFGRGRLPFCRMCREELEPPVSPRLHVVSSNRASHVNHTCREIVLDHLSLLSWRGFPIDQMEQVWSRLLYDCPHFPRVRSLVSSTTSLTERIDDLIGNLILLKDLGILDISLASAASDNDSTSPMAHRRRLAFERLEYLGDSAWRDAISDRLMLLFPDQRWAYSEGSSAFNALRDAMEMNVTLSLLYDKLQLSRLFPLSARLAKSASKGKADVVEALLGELHLTVWGMVPMLYDDAPFVEVNGQYEKWQVALVEHCLTDLYDLLVLSLALELSHTAVPLAKEMAAYHMWSPVRPFMSHQKPLVLRRLMATSTTTASARSAVSVPVQLCWPLPTPPRTRPAVDGDDDDDSASSRRAGSEAEQTAGERDAALAATVSAGSLAHLVARPPVRFTLPASPALSTEPVAPLPLTSLTSPLLALSLDAIPVETVLHPFPHQPQVRRDVFAAYRTAYTALGLLDATTLLAPIMHVRRRPAWRWWAASLVPSVEWAAGSSTQAAGESDALESEFTAAARPGVTVAEEPLYFRDGRLDLAPQPSTAPSDRATVSRLSSDGAQLRVALANAPPGDMQAEPTVSEDDAASTAMDDALVDAALRHYAPSRYVPHGVKPPLGGVLTERNTCHGMFAFLSDGHAPWETLLPLPLTTTMPAPEEATDASVDPLKTSKRRAAALWETENAFFPKRVNPFRLAAAAPSV